MKNIGSFVLLTIKGGVLFLIPVVMLLVVLEKAHQIISKLISPLAGLIPVESLFGMGMARLLAIVALVVVSFAAGIISRTAPAKKFVKWLEESLLSKLPGYALVKSLGSSLTGLEEEKSLQVVLARIEDAWQIGFLSETLDNGLFAVYVPGSPSISSGSVYFMTEDRFQRLDITLRDALLCLRTTGRGSQKVFAGKKIHGADEGNVVPAGMAPPA